MAGPSKCDLGQLLHEETYQDCNTDIVLLCTCAYKPSKHDIGQLWLEDEACSDKIAVVGIK